ncbi:D-alanyl-D-alanine carboxypeptidase family protein [Aminicella lysinilytica]|uniref:serine-type D-Ala-D-Ala carboxypeptidase n=1 Tax=Aminicella lysinilytica TaxID=433323 RepID=A0A4R6QCA4_9FIRM|nr:D-alanyl-D-alanine carboxypeptidase family protein [Aminicella lysinilytica]TDP59586.1 D-alanyl-D-alanine carboxypeptidase (penicillin-binding protein 5/6) [Aminicella lysinilytica]
MYKCSIKKLTVILMSALIVIAMSGLSSQAFAVTKVTKPSITAGGAMVYCENTGEVVYSKNAGTRYSPYSITKLVTALLAVQNLPLDKEVTVSAKVAAIGETTMSLEPGEKVTVEQLLYGMLMLSGNDAAYALGEAVSGNMNDFVALMNKTAKNIGCTHTHFANPNGMKSSSHYTTAGDFIQITRVALSNSTIKKIAGTKVYKMKATNKNKARTFKTHMDLLTDSGSGVYAGKTGYWTQYDCSLACAYKKNGLNLYIVILADTKTQRENDLKKLIDYSVKKVDGVRVVKAGKNEGKVRIKHGVKTRIDAYTSEDAYAYLPKEGSKSLISTKTVMDDDVKAPITRGTEVGTLKIYVGDDLVNQVPLVVNEDVATGWFPSYLGISNFASVIIGLVALAVMGFFIWVVAMRASYRRKKKKIRQRKIMRMAEEEARREAERNRRDWHF